MDQSIATDYAADRGCPEPYLRRIAEAGFSHIHWCHQWCTDFLYCEAEIAQIQRWLKDYGLRLQDLHAPGGPEKNWHSTREYERIAGVELLRNRIEMVARLGGRAIVLHPPLECERDEVWSAACRSLDELKPVARGAGVRIALENLSVLESWDSIQRLLSHYEPDYLGLCYDSGHGNIAPGSIERLDRWKERLFVLHLHDNNGADDEHRLPFNGTVPWERLMPVITSSAYDGPISQEIGMGKEPIEDEAEFLRQALERGRRLATMMAEGRREKDER
mgnify:CR=1 FL=1